MVVAAGNKRDAVKVKLHTTGPISLGLPSGSGAPGTGPKPLKAVIF